ncbi:hypothetical protein ACVWZ3_004680 [Bradyrhizobium sp. i1.3.6]
MIAPMGEGMAMRRIITGLVAITCLWPTASLAEIVRFDILAREPAFAGRSFGDVGTYERITARVRPSRSTRRTIATPSSPTSRSRRVAPTARWQPPPTS